MTLVCRGGCMASCAAPTAVRTPPPSLEVASVPFHSLHHGVVHATASLRHLAQRHRLDPLHRQLPDPEQASRTLLHRLATEGCGLQPSELGECNASWLMSEELIAPGKLPKDEARLPFVFVRAINLELSYSCNLACSHCLQTPLRPRGASTWLDPELVRALLEQAKDLDLLRTGLNVTGGETFAGGSSLLEVLDIARSLAIPVRANTNAWWGLQQDIRIGTEIFRDDRAVVEHLCLLGLSRLALSLDGRYSQYPELLERLIRVATLCEQLELDYEFVATDADPRLLSQVQERIASASGGSLLHARLTTMETVDIGSAPPRKAQPISTAGLPALARRSDCGTAGFHRPSFLHVSPDGGVRSCLYAPGAGWHGNLHQQSLRSILNAAARNPVLQLFERGDLEDFVARHLEPWRHLYRQVEHGCGAAALIARLAERVGQLEANSVGAPTAMALEQLHRRLAVEMGLAARA